MLSGSDLRAPPFTRTLSRGGILIRIGFDGKKAGRKSVCDTTALP